MLHSSPLVPNSPLSIYVLPYLPQLKRGQRLNVKGNEKVSVSLADKLSLLNVYIPLIIFNHLMNEDWGPPMFQGTLLSYIIQILH